MGIQVLDVNGAKSFLKEKVKKLTGMNLDLSQFDSSEEEDSLFDFYREAMERIENTDLAGAQDRLENLLDRHDDLDGKRICIPKELRAFVVESMAYQTRWDSLKMMKNLVAGMVIGQLGFIAADYSVVKDSDTAAYLGVAILGVGCHFAFVRGGKYFLKGIIHSIKRGFDDIFSRPFTEREADFADYIYGPRF